MVAYHWALAFVMLAGAVGLELYSVVQPWPALGDARAQAGVVAFLGLAVIVVAERAWFVTFTRVRSDPEALTVRARGDRLSRLFWGAIEAAHTSSFDAFPFGRLRILRVHAQGRTVTIPLARHPADDDVFASIVRNARLAPTDPNWQNDIHHGACDWVKVGRREAIDALRMMRRQVRAAAFAYGVLLCGFLLLWATATGDSWLVWILLLAFAVLAFALWLDGRRGRG